MIEDVATQYTMTYKKIPVKKVVIRGVPRSVLLKPEDAKIRLNYQRFSLGDRVIYATDTGAVPLGMKGTVVGVDDKSIDVLFDGSFMGGTSLDGR
jgi:5'-3' exoribonuclease 1